MTVSVLRRGEFVVVPWTNGGGTTREVARFPAGADFDWRISIAGVPRSSTFSALPGIDRVIVPLDEVAMVLTIDGLKRVVRPYQPFAFSGDSVTSCMTGAERSQDLNVMTRRGAALAQVSVSVAPDLIVEAGSGTTVVLPMTAARTGSVTDALGDVDDGIILEPLDALLLSGDVTCRLSGAGPVAVIRLT